MKNFFIYLIAFVLMLIIILLQYNLFSIYTLVGTMANLGLVLISAIGLLTGRERGAVSRYSLWTYARYFGVRNAWSIYAAIYAPWLFYGEIRQKSFKR